MERVLANWQEVYYLEPVASLFALYAIYKLLLTTKELKFRSLFLCYVISIFHLFILGDLTVYFEPNTLKTIPAIEVMNLVFAIVEAYVFYTFYISIIENKVVKTALRFLSWGTYLFIATGIYFLFFNTYTLEVRRYLDIIFTLELSLLIFPAIWYFYELSSQKTAYDYKVLLVCLCFTGYCLLSVPFYSILDWLRSVHMPGYNLLFALHYLCIASVCLTLSAYPTRSYQLKMNFFRRVPGKFISFVQLR